MTANPDFERGRDASVFRSLGHVVDVVATGRDAITRAASKPFLLDELAAVVLAELAA